MDFYFSLNISKFWLAVQLRKKNTVAFCTDIKILLAAKFGFFGGIIICFEMA
jgi:hypothetical protein